MKQEEKNRALIVRFKRLSQRGVPSHKLRDIIEQIDWTIELNRIQRDFDVTLQTIANELGLILDTVNRYKSKKFKPSPPVAKLLEKLGWL